MMNTWVTLPYLGQVNIWDWRMMTIAVLLVLAMISLVRIFKHINDHMNSIETSCTLCHRILNLSMVLFVLYFVVIATKEHYRIQDDIRIAELLEESGHYSLARDVYLEILEQYEDYRDLSERVERLDNIMGMD